jgi:hypothetical protein
MNPKEIIFGGILAAVLLGLAGYFAWRQKNTLGKLREQDLDPEDRLYIYRQVQRRLLCSVLMVVLAGMLVGWFFLESQVRSEVAGVQKVDEPGPPDAERRNTIRVFTFYWIAFLLVLLVILFLAAGDLLATARFGLRQQRRLEAERRTVLESETARLRRERNGQ